jgi:hypothetical protein
MVKDQDRLVAEMAVRSLANFIKAKDFANLLEEFEECTDFIKYDIVDMIDISDLRENCLMML